MGVPMLHQVLPYPYIHRSEVGHGQYELRAKSHLGACVSQDQFMVYSTPSTPYIQSTQEIDCIGALLIKIEISFVEF